MSEVKDMFLKTNKIEHKDLLMDKNGVVRLGDLVLNDALIRSIIEYVYVTKQIDLKIKRISQSFEELDRGHGGVKHKGMKKWTVDERRTVLMNPDLSNETVGLQLDRSGMSIMMCRSSLMTEFDAWRIAKQNSGLMTGEQQVDEFLNEFYKDR
jgi:hypothetical protein